MINLIFFLLGLCIGRLIVRYAKPVDKAIDDTVYFIWCQLCKAGRSTKEFLKSKINKHGKKTKS